MAPFNVPLCSTGREEDSASGFKEIEGLQPSWQALQDEGVLSQTFITRQQVHQLWKAISHSSGFECDASRFHFVALEVSFSMPLA